MSLQRSLLAAAALAAVLGACADAPTSASSHADVHPARVVLVSIDGLRGDAMAHMPTLSSLRDEGVWSDSMLTIVPSLTVPGHVSMLTGRDASTFGLVSNTPDTATVMRLIYGGASTVFDWVHGAGGRTEAVAGAALVPQSELGQMKLLFGADSLIATTLDASSVITQAIGLAGGADAPALLFVHLSDVDLEGHANGWIVPGVRSAAGGDSLAPGYVAAAVRTDAALARLVAALRPAIDSGTTALIVTADHGGGHGEGCTPGVPAYREHCTADLNDRTIPFVLVARGLTAHRLDGHPRITQVAGTISALLHDYRPPAADVPVAY